MTPINYKNKPENSKDIIGNDLIICLHVIHQKNIYFKATCYFMFTKNYTKQY